MQTDGLTDRQTDILKEIFVLQTNGLTEIYLNETKHYRQMDRQIYLKKGNNYRQTDRQSESVFEENALQT